MVAGSLCGGLGFSLAFHCFCAQNRSSRGGGVQFSFGEYVLDADRRELLRGSTLIPTAPRVFDLLDYLVITGERVVSKDELLRAVWGGRVVSDSTLARHIHAVRKAIADSGNKQGFIRTVARRGYRFVGNVSERQSKPELVNRSNGEDSEAPAPRLPDKPSLVVLPFQNLSGDPEQEYFADAVVNDITTGLSKFRNLLVIARSSSFQYKGKAID